jgi:putative IMPACT (imprinted ancient) family translation regulator
MQISNDVIIGKISNTHQKDDNVFKITCPYEKYALIRNMLEKFAREVNVDFEQNHSFTAGLPQS